jgi:serine/threonine protein kinase
VLSEPESCGLRRGTPEFDAVAAAVADAAVLQQSLVHESIAVLRGVTVHPVHKHVQWVVTEHANGGSLDAWLAARGRVTLEELVDLLRSVMAAVAYLHSRTPAVHCDVTPANVLVYTSPCGGIVWKLGTVGTAAAAATAATDAADGGAVTSAGVMAAELVLRHMDIAGFERVGDSARGCVERRSAVVDEACARLRGVCPALASVLRDCCVDASSSVSRCDAAAAVTALRSIAVDSVRSAPISRSLGEVRTVALCRERL